jgi:hypothetical protein
MIRANLKWHPSLINIGADPATKTIVHKMGPLLVPLKPLNRDGKDCIRLTLKDKQRVDSYLVPITDVLTQCGVE